MTNKKFKPDWNELEACRESLREHMDMINKLNLELLQVHEIIPRMKNLLCRIAYPQRGTGDETMNIVDAAQLIQSYFRLEELEE